ncbi:MAG: NADPH-dependent F420 reductase [Chloroflexi bacterium]|nr:NADPH-dependent F420 reductase [Chloroflexota bacterium]
MHHTIAFIGGTGPEGLGLAVRFAHAGDTVIIGSRKIERAQEAAETIKKSVPHAKAQGMENDAAARAADIVMITVPFSGQKDTLEQLREAIGEKIVVDTVVPLQFEKGKIRALILEEGSATQQAQKLLPNAKVVGAFHNLSAHDLAKVDHDMGSDVVVCGDHPEAKKTVMALAHKIKGVRAVDAGGLETARYIEDITALLLNINKIYKAHSSIKIVGV